MSPAQKAVLISLADQANDQGVCWPAVDSIAMRCCLSKRAVQQAIKWLRSAGIVSVEERQGRSTMYSVTPAAYAPPQEMHPRSICTPAANAPTPADAAPPPPQEMHPTPADAAPRTVIEPTREPSGNAFADPFRFGD
ncbi:helix-turn-helix domain-containing protein [Pseudomonas aeruginosa]|uniref:helix-turn-helix domain-containing protein n=1 Tax=Pseudomonas aeruginosa TaxID=287 RepID=UPI0021A87AAE|nr:helix-turn-helix domain-containing protein [Pseudomonas aeruginosa]UWU65344.1 helix-turn-helix domain-containing protein [Pseudomonas aeruginosa]